MKILVQSCIKMYAHYHFMNCVFCGLYLLIENGTTFLLKTIPLIGVKPVALQMQKQHKNDDKYGYQARNYQTVLPGI